MGGGRHARAIFLRKAAPRWRELATASARMYPEFVHELEDESGLKIDLRSRGLLFLTFVETGPSLATTQPHALPQPLAELEPALQILSTPNALFTALYIKERCVDPRHLTAAAIAAARHRGVDFSSGDHVLAVEVADGKACRRPHQQDTVCGGHGGELRWSLGRADRAVLVPDPSSQRADAVRSSCRKKKWCAMWCGRRDGTKMFT